ncbi:phosphate signaling complex protein PhoU [Bacillus carboniphilus]|uniref:Phosphate-specific transport system accessory protein PhoU n=1 Tax=Bacillus carboniphilus TaxID=86663 RepID=A0ABN0WSH5_9BACI
MNVRQEFQEELNVLKSLLLNMGKRAENALRESIKALQEQDVDLALKIIDEDYKINRLDDEINEKAIWLIAKQQPVATDLRRIIASIKIATDLERVGDQAVNIAKSTIRIGKEALFKPLKDIPAMADRVLQMHVGVLEAFDKEDYNLAKEVAEMDNEVDEMYGKLVNELLSNIPKSPELTAQITQLAFVCRYLERSADHTTNISESVIFTVKGKNYDLNR